VSFFKYLFGETRATTTNFTDAWGRDVDWNGPSRTATGVNVNAHKALQLIAVWACVRLIAESIASLPTAAFVRKGQVRELYQPRPGWMFNPNPEQIAMVFWEQALTSLLLYGNAYVYLVRDRDTTVLELWPLHPDYVSPRRDGPNYRLQYHVIDPLTGATSTLTPGVDIMHIPGFSMPGSLVGLNPIQYAKQAIGLGLGTEEFGGRFFSQGSTASVVLEAEKEVSETALKRAAEAWKKAHSGLKNAHFPVLLEGGLTAKPLSIPNDQAQFLETRGFQLNEIARFFRVPPHMISDVAPTTSWGTGIEQQGIGFVVYTLRPWIERVEQSATILFPAESRAFMKFNVDGLLRGDLKGRYDAYATGVNNGFLSVDEVRALEDRPPLPGGKGQAFRQPLNFGPVGDPTPKQGNNGA
jgi:HK97 family phage portal protein